MASDSAAILVLNNGERVRVTESFDDVRRRLDAGGFEACTFTTDERVGWDCSRISVCRYTVSAVLEATNG